MISIINVLDSDIHILFFFNFIHVSFLKIIFTELLSLDIEEFVPIFCTSTKPFLWYIYQH